MPHPKLRFVLRHLAAGITTGALALVLACGAEPEGDPLAEILSAKSPHRATFGRLGSELGARPFSATVARRCAESSPLLDARIRRSYLEARNEAASLEPAARAARFGLLYLAICAYDDAVAELEAAAARRPGSAEIANHLAVAYATRGVAEASAYDRVLALAAIQRALELAPEDPVVRFNHALLLGSLPLRHQAIDAWRGYLAVAGDATWTNEARSHLAVLQGPSRRELWDEVAGTLDPAEPERTADATRTFPWYARRHAERTLLPGWADATTANDPDAARRALDIARTIGETLARDRGEHLLADAADVIDADVIDADGGATGTVPGGLVEGHRLLGEGLRAYDRQEIATAREPLERASRSLAEAGSPFADWARFYAAICVYYADADRADAMFRELARRVEPGRHPALFGRVHWLLGTIAGVQGRDQEGFASYELALRHLSTSSGKTRSGFVHVLLAEAYAPLGEVEIGWHHRLRAFEALALSGEPRRIHSMLNEAAQALLREGRPRLARPFLDEMIENARTWSDHPIAAAEAHAQRGWNRIALGETDAALDDLERSREILAAMASSSLTAWLGSWIEIYEGLAWIDRDPARAVELLTSAFERQAAGGYAYGRSQLLADRARAQARLGRPEAAAADLRRAVRLAARTREDVADPGLKLRFFRQAQPAFEALLRLEIENDPASTLAIAEAARSRFLADLRAGDAPDPAQLRRLGGELKPGTALVEYAVLAEEVLAWVIHRENLRLVRLPVREDELRMMIETLRRDLESWAPEAASRASGAVLHDALITPLGLPEETASLVVVPDRFLAELPFAALFDARSGRYLVERFPVTLTPGIALLARRDVSETVLPGSTLRALVIGEPEIRGTPHAHLGSLEGAAEEGGRIAAFYGEGASFLTGADATEDRFLAALARVDVVHFAGHALANAEVPQRSFLLLAPGEAGDGLLRSEELWDEGLDGVDLVVLSACETMAGHGDGREALFGVAGGFFGAGVGEIVATLWPVRDTANVELMTRFHRHYEKTRRAAPALRAAILELLAEDDPDARNPARWGALMVLGSNL